MKYGDLDPLLTAPSRLAVVATLADGRWWSFTELREATGLADGNLHVQARRLVEAGYLERDEAERGGRRVTVFRLEPGGRRAVESLVRDLETALGRGRAEQRADDEPGRRRRPRPRPPGELDPRPDRSRVW